MRCRVFCVTALLLPIALCAMIWTFAAEPPTDKAEPRAAGRPRPKKSDANEGPIDIDKLTYHDPSIRAVVAEMDAIAEEIAGDDWLHDPWHKRRHRKDYHDYTATWGTTRSRGGYISNIWPDRPLHIIKLIAAPLLKDTGIIWDATVIASWYPEGENVWGTHVVYSTSLFARPRDVQRDNFLILFRRSQDFELSLPGRGYFGKRKFGEIEYQFGVGDSPSSDRDVRPYLESAESMRDQALGVIEYLEDRLRKEIPSGKAITSLIDPSLPPQNPVDPEPPSKRSLKPPFPKRYELTEAQREEILEQALADLKDRKRLWQEHYRELYAAAEKAFPIKRLFAVEHDRRDP